MKETAREHVAAIRPRTITDLEAPFWEGLQEKKLMVQTCRDCGYVQSPPSSMCTECTSPHIEWTACSGRAVLWSRVTFHKSYLAPYPDLPYHVAIVKLAEGPFMTGRLAEEYGDTAIDAALEAEFYETADGSVLLGFRPAN